MDNKFIITTIATIALALIGYLAKYYNDIKIQNRKDKLDRLNRQLKEFYGPLLSLLSSSNSSWAKFRANHRKDVTAYFDVNSPPSENEKKTWREWMSIVFIPINEKVYDLIINNADLIIEDNFPHCFKDFCAHVETYRPVVKKWENNDYSEHTATINFPIEIVGYVEESYRILKQQQNSLIV